MFRRNVFGNNGFRPHLNKDGKGTGEQELGTVLQHSPLHEDEDVILDKDGVVMEDPVVMAPPHDPPVMESLEVENVDQEEVVEDENEGGTKELQQAFSKSAPQSPLSLSKEKGVSLQKSTRSRQISEDEYLLYNQDMVTNQDQKAFTFGDVGNASFVNLHQVVSQNPADGSFIIRKGSYLREGMKYQVLRATDDLEWAFIQILERTSMDDPSQGWVKYDDIRQAKELDVAAMGSAIDIAEGLVEAMTFGNMLGSDLYSGLPGTNEPRLLECLTWALDSGLYAEVEDLFLPMARNRKTLTHGNDLFDYVVKELRQDLQDLKIALQHYRNAHHHGKARINWLGKAEEYRASNKRLYRDYMAAMPKHAKLEMPYEERLEAIMAIASEGWVEGSKEEALAEWLEVFLEEAGLTGERKIVSRAVSGDGSPDGQQEKPAPEPGIGMANLIRLKNDLARHNLKLYQRLERVMDGKNRDRLAKSVAQLAMADKPAERNKDELAAILEQYKAMKEKGGPDAFSNSDLRTMGDSLRILPYATYGLFRSTVKMGYEYRVKIEGGRVKVKVLADPGFPGFSAEAHLLRQVYHASGMATVAELDLAPDELIGIQMIHTQEEMGSGALMPTTSYGLMVMPAINLKLLERKENANDWSNLLAAGEIVLATIGSAVTANPTFLTLAILTNIYTVANALVLDYKPELMKSEAGKRFLDAWEDVTLVMTILGVAELAVGMFHLVTVLPDLLKAVGQFKGKEGMAAAVNNLVDRVRRSRDDIKNLGKTVMGDSEAAARNAVAPARPRASALAMDEFKGAWKKVWNMNPTAGAGAGLAPSEEFIAACIDMLKKAYKAGTAKAGDSWDDLLHLIRKSNKAFDEFMNGNPGASKALQDAVEPEFRNYARENTPDVAPEGALDDGVKGIDGAGDEVARSADEVVEDAGKKAVKDIEQTPINPHSEGTESLSILPEDMAPPRGYDPDLVTHQEELAKLTELRNKLSSGNLSEAEVAQVGREIERIEDFFLQIHVDEVHRTYLSSLSKHTKPEFNRAAIEAKVRNNMVFDPQTKRFSAASSGTPDIRAKLASGEFNLGTATSTPKKSGVHEITVKHENLDARARQHLKDLEAQRQAATARKRQIELEFDQRSRNRRNLTEEPDAPKRVQDDPEWVQAHKEQISASEALGELAVDSVVQKHMPGARKVVLDLGDKAKQGTFDAIYEYQGRYYIFEAKGGGSTLGARRVASGKLAEQGTKAYVGDIISHMENKATKLGDEDLLDEIEQIKIAFENQKLEYLATYQKIGKNGQLVTEVNNFKFEL